MLEIPTHTFGERKEFTVKRFSAAGERRINLSYAKKLHQAGTEASTILEFLDGGAIYAQCLLEECLIDAPAEWWDDDKDKKPTMSLENVMPEDFQYVAEETQRWLDTFRTQNPRGDLAGSATEPSNMDDSQAVPAPFKGRAA